MNPPPETQPPALRKLLIEFGPLLAFFLSQRIWDLQVATGVLMAAMIPSLTASWVTERRLPPMALVTAVIVMIFGGLTIYFGNDLFIKLKPTIVNLLFAAALTSGLLLRQPLLKVALGPVFHLTDEGWRVLTIRWIFFFLALAALNEIVWRNFSPDTWVSFKVFGILPLTMVFSATLLPLINRHQLAKEEVS